MKQITINVKTLDEKRKAASTLIIDLLKNHGIPGDRAVHIYRTNKPEFIIRKCFQLDYYSQKPGTRKILDSMRWLQAAINNNYEETDEFLNWYKTKRDYLLDSTQSKDLQQLLGV